MDLKWITVTFALKIGCDSSDRKPFWRHFTGKIGHSGIPHRL